MSELRHSTWRASPSLATATLNALRELSHHWRPQLALAFENSEDGQSFLADYAFACKDADLHAITMAARQWHSDSEHKWPPRPSELGQLARELTAKHFPREPEPAPPLPPVRIVDDKRLTELHKRAAAVLGSQAKVPFVWLALRDHATTPADIEALRVGEVSDAVFDAALAAVKRQSVAA